MIPELGQLKQIFENIAYFRLFVDFPHTFEMMAHLQLASFAAALKNFAQLIAVLPQDFLILQL